ncbi:general transcription factor IIH subunit 5 isoform X2 [Drosophila miranda]|uniref:general transcription factor IIH subunit 5 isoform X2 n=1 Tax=Drosophila miranda TaxID=7229 RepID=UPI0007E8213F|nr:general transcription factor IIH subunit 5 isoform X2 [Drosophila miranda]
MHAHSCECHGHIIFPIFTNCAAFLASIYLKCDPAMKQFLLHLDEKLALGRKFIIQDLDESHLFISTDIVEVLQARVDDLMDRISFPLHDKDA